MGCQARAGVLVNRLVSVRVAYSPGEVTGRWSGSSWAVSTGRESGLSFSLRVSRSDCPLLDSQRDCRGSSRLVL